MRSGERPRCRAMVPIFVARAHGPSFFGVGYYEPAGQLEFEGSPYAFSADEPTSVEQPAQTGLAKVVCGLTGGEWNELTKQCIKKIFPPPGLVPGPLDQELEKACTLTGGRWDLATKTCKKPPPPPSGDKMTTGEWLALGGTALILVWIFKDIKKRR